MLENFVVLCGYNLFKTLHIIFYQNRSSIVEVMVKIFWCVFVSVNIHCVQKTRVYIFSLDLRECEICIDLHTIAAIVLDELKIPIM